MKKTDKHDEGSICDIEDCPGTLEYKTDGDCSCHIAPPCSVCTSSVLTCNHCGEKYE